jgi:glycine hydroxymethyltransferase
MSHLYDGYFTTGLGADPELAELIRGELRRQSAEFADAIEALAIRRACQVFECRFANVQPHFRSNANAGVLLGLLRLGDQVVSTNVAAGGHISHGHPATLTGRDYKIAAYGVNRETELIDLDEIRDLALRKRPGLIIAGGSPYSRAIDLLAYLQSLMKSTPTSWSIWLISPG